MKTIVDRIGNTEVFFQVTEEDVFIEDGKGGPTLILTSISIEDKIRPMYAKLNAVIKAMAEEFGAELTKIDSHLRPTEAEVEYNLGVSGQVGPIFIFGKGEYLLKVRMKWRLSKDEPSQ